MRQFQGRDPNFINVPVIGGHAGATILPLPSQDRAGKTIEGEKIPELGKVEVPQVQPIDFVRQVPKPEVQVRQKQVELPVVQIIEWAIEVPSITVREEIACFSGQARRSHHSSRRVGSHNSSRRRRVGSLWARSPASSHRGSSHLGQGGSARRSSDWPRNVAHAFVLNETGDKRRTDGGEWYPTN